MKNGITASEVKAEAIKNANINDEQSMKNLFNAVANCEYLNNTAKTYEQLKEYNSADWTDGVDCSEFKSIEDCVIAAEAAADQYLEEEN